MQPEKVLYLYERKRPGRKRRSAGIKADNQGRDAGMAGNTEALLRHLKPAMLAAQPRRSLLKDPHTESA
jgi:hypothetical protein